MVGLVLSNKPGVRDNSGLSRELPQASSGCTLSVLKTSNRSCLSHVHTRRKLSMCEHLRDELTLYPSQSANGAHTFQILPHQHSLFPGGFICFVVLDYKPTGLSLLGKCFTWSCALSLLAYYHSRPDACEVVSDCSFDFASSEKTVLFLLNGVGTLAESYLTVYRRIYF